MKCILFLLSILWASQVIAESSLGVRSIEVMGPGGARPLALTQWYPGQGGVPETVGGNAVFAGVTAGRDAQPDDGVLPLVVVSHGGLRSAADSGAWLSAGLARAGFLVVEVNAARPGSAADAVNEIWRRPDDISAALNAVLSDAAWSGRIDTARISVVGFALGGTAALALAGGEIAPDAFTRSCDPPKRNPDCVWFQRQDVSLANVDSDALARPRRDARITSVIAIAPEHLALFSGEYSSPGVPLQIVVLGDGPGADTPADAVLALPNTTPFDAFQACTPRGAAILAEEGGDPALCGPSSDARYRAHDEILQAVLTHLASARPD